MNLYLIMREQKINKAELGRRLSWHLPQVDRLLDVHHGSQLDQLEAAFKAMGKRLVVNVRDQDDFADEESIGIITPSKRVFHGRSGPRSSVRKVAAKKR